MKFWKNFSEKISFFLLSLIIFGFPLENKYDKPLRRLSFFLIPDGITLPDGFEKKIYFHPTDIGAILLFLILMIGLKTPIKRLFLEPKRACLWILSICAFLSICFSPLSNYGVLYFRLMLLLTPVFLYSFIVETKFYEKRVHFFLSLFLLAAFLQSIFAMTQYFTQDSLGLRIFNESRDVPSSFGIPNGSRWIFDSISGYIGPSSLVKRAIGTLNHSNLLGGFLAFSSFILYAFIVEAKKRWVRYSLGLLLFLFFFTLSITYSRSAIFGLILGTGLWFAIAIYKGSFKECTFLMKTILLSGAVCLFLFFEQFQYRGGLLNYNSMVKSSDQIRINAQGTAIQMMKDHPFFGVGYGQFANASLDYVQKGEETPLAHNMYLLIGAEMGIIALTALLSFIAMALFEAMTAPMTPKMISFISIFCLFLFIGLCDFYPLVIQEGKLMLFISSAFMMAEAKKLKSRETLLCSP